MALPAPPGSRQVNQDQIAEELGVVQQTVSAWEKGRAIPEPGQVERIAEVLGLDGFELHVLVAQAYKERNKELEPEVKRGHEAVQELKRFTDTYSEFHASYEEIVETVRLLAVELAQLSSAVTALAEDVAVIKKRTDPGPVKRRRPPG